MPSGSKEAHGRETKPNPDYILSLSTLVECWCIRTCPARVLHVHRRIEPVWPTVYQGIETGTCCVVESVADMTRFDSAAMDYVVQRWFVAMG